MKVHFLPEGSECTFEIGKSILKLTAETGIVIDVNCAGNGTCGKCKIKVISRNDESSAKKKSQY